jgi:hypothetical protein
MLTIKLDEEMASRGVVMTIEGGASFVALEILSGSLGEPVEVEATSAVGASDAASLAWYRTERHCSN